MKPKRCICPTFGDTGGFRIGDLCCPVHGVEGAEPLDGPDGREPGSEQAAGYRDQVAEDFGRNASSEPAPREPGREEPLDGPDDADIQRELDLAKAYCSAVSRRGLVCHFVEGHPGRVHVDLSHGGFVYWSLPDDSPFRNLPAVPEDPLQDAPAALREAADG